MVSIFSIDVEDWYQGLGIPLNEWSKYEKRIKVGMIDLLNLMNFYGIKSTCFILGKTAEDHPDLIKLIHNEGHEIATHGYSHELVYKMSPKDFTEDLSKSINILTNITGEKILGYRAPYFSITKKSLWALDILLENDILYDSSIHPVINWRYGIPDASRKYGYIKTLKGNKLFEFPVSTFPYPFFNLPVSGGAYFRIYNYNFTKYHLRKILQKDEYLNFYIHPWELDYAHPKIDLPFKISSTHYFNLRSTYNKLNMLFKEFQFSSISEIYKELIK